MNSISFSVEHLGLAARDPRALADWYCRILGGREIWENGQNPPAVFVALPGGPMLELYPTELAVPQTGDNRTAGWRHLALRVSSLENAAAELQRRGLNLTESPKPAGGGGRVLFFADLEGNLLHLVERSADSVFAWARVEPGQADARHQ
jgi:glyoxylase I family protein